MWWLSEKHPFMFRSRRDVGRLLFRGHTPGGSHGAHRAGRLRCSRPRRSRHGSRAGHARPAGRDRERDGRRAELTSSRQPPRSWRRCCARWWRALEASPVPKFEWAGLGRVLDREQLASLLAVSLSSLNRYQSGDRETPDAIAARLHFLALVIGDLAGSYNDIGIRRWFGRKRSASRRPHARTVADRRMGSRRCRAGARAQARPRAGHNVGHIMSGPMIAFRPGRRALSVPVGGRLPAGRPVARRGRGGRRTTSPTRPTARGPSSCVTRISTIRQISERSAVRCGRSRLASPPAERVDLPTDILNRRSRHLHAVPRSRESVASDGRQWSLRRCRRR